MLLVSCSSCARFSQLRANRMTPPVSGCARRRRSSALRVVPATSRIRGACSVMGRFKGQLLLN